VTRAEVSDYDIVVVGAGVVGCAVARELALRPWRVALLDAADDVGDGTSKANTAILHTGFDAAPGTLESRLVARGYALLSAYAAEAGIPVERVGALLVAWDEDQLAALPGLAEKATRNGYPATRFVTADELYRREPHLGLGARGALEVPDESIICPWTTTLAYATEALSLGAELLLGTRLFGVTPVEGGGHLLTTSQGDIATTYVINAAGLRSDEVDQMFGHDGFTVTPRRGELVVFDKLTRSLVSHILLPVPTARGKGVLVAPTVYGNVMLGPTADDLADKTATGTTEEGLNALRRQGSRIMPALLEEEVTTTYAGLRAATEHGDYQVELHAAQGYVCVGGIRSTGLTASLALAEHVAGLMVEAGWLSGPAQPSTPPLMPNIGEAFPRPYAQAERIAADPEYGQIICHCERVTAGEIRDALDGPLPPVSAEGLRRRTRAGMGRCQGFFCGAEVEARLRSAREQRLPS
jgi:glycerol-3-phosphate dehydrogenase